jgi:hypothetical protein
MGSKLELTLMLKVAVIALLLHGFSGSRPLGAQTLPSTQTGNQTGQQEDQRGDVVSGDFFTDTRPSSKNPRPTKSRYRDRRPAATQRVPPTGKVFVRLGVTLGRGRATTEAEIKDNSIAKVSICAERRGDSCISWREMAIERISDDTPISDGTPIQMMIEYLASQDAAGTKQVSNRVGYLYVINRVEFKGKPPTQQILPKLIFPTALTFGGDNRVLPGKTVILPGPQRLWKITRNKQATQEFETYIIIITPEPLRDSQGKALTLGETPLELDEKLVKSWVNQWGGGEIQSDLEQGVGQLFSKREQSASGDPTETSRDTDEMDADLNQGDPSPQMVFRKAVAPGGAMLITIRLPFKDTAAPAAPKP